MAHRNKFSIPALLKPFAVYLCNNENPFGESRLRKLGKQLLEHCNIARYPNNYYPALRSALSRLHSIDENQLLIGNGSSEILMFLARAFLSRGRTALCSEYSFSFYSIASSMTGAEVRFVSSKYYGHDVDALLEAAADAQVIFLDNPCNPTGRYLNEVTMRSLLQHIPESTLLVVDEAYAEYATSPDFKSCIGFVDQYPNLVVVRTLSKAYGLAGLRLGYGISNPMLIGQLEHTRPPFNINALTAELARMALEDADFIAACRSHNAAERRRLQTHPVIAPYCVAASEGNFLLLKTPDGSNIVERLRKHHVHVRGFREYPDHIRVTIGTVQENQAFIDAFSKVIASVTAETLHREVDLPSPNQRVCNTG